MKIADIFTLRDGRTVYGVTSDEVPDIHDGDTLVDSIGNKFRITAVGNVTKCFGLKYTLSLILDGNAERGKITICKDIKS